jgi:predicted negative regulator of RcsB-dependent stress response
MYDLEEQEQLEALKAWWKQYGRLVIAAFVAFIAGVGGVQGWQHYQRSQAEQASELFGTLEQAVGKNDATEIRNVGSEITGKYSRTAYAAMAALVVAKTEHDQGQLDAAAKQLQWAVDNGKTEEVRALARLRLAGVLLDQKKFDEALKLLDTKGTEALDPLYSDLRGDVLVAQGKVDEARAAYDRALEKSTEAGTWRNVIQVKRDALGSGK